jgi:hypothetical protein
MIMKITKHIVDMDTILFGYLRCLHEIPKVHQRANGDEEALGNDVCDDGHDVTLDVTMFPTGDLLQLGYAFMKLSKTCVWMEDEESIIDSALPRARMHH